VHSEAARMRAIASTLQLQHHKPVVFYRIGIPVPRSGHHSRPSRS
jgi:hypothetical protein